MNKVKAIAEKKRKKIAKLDGLSREEMMRLFVEGYSRSLNGR